MRIFFPQANKKNRLDLFLLGQDSSTMQVIYFMIQLFYVGNIIYFLS